MAQEDKKLLLKELSARLPYGVRCNVKYVINNETTHGEDVESECIDIIKRINFDTYSVYTEWLGYESDIENIKPYLRPISSMTDEEMDRLFDILHIDKDGKDEDWIKINDVYGIKFFFPTGKWIENVVEAYDYLYSIHIDFRGLIHKGLAVEVTPENNPYEN